MALYTKKVLIDNRVIEKDVVNFGESVAIIPQKDDRRIVLINQFRVPIGKWILEVPAGRIEQGESYIEAANRELMEEVGYKAKKLTRLLSIYASPGYSDEVVHIILARELEAVGASPEPSEVISVIEMDIDDAIENILGMDVVDAKTFISLMYYYHYYHRVGMKVD